MTRPAGSHMTDAGIPRVRKLVLRGARGDGNISSGNTPLPRIGFDSLESAFHSAGKHARKGDEVDSRAGSQKSELCSARTQDFCSEGADSPLFSSFPNPVPLHSLLISLPFPSLPLSFFSP